MVVAPEIVAPEVVAPATFPSDLEKKTAPVSALRPFSSPRCTASVWVSVPEDLNPVSVSVIPVE